ncbi:hypothetical protein JTE90_015175 [Oedothorax gibbosus]|uniref:Uncharacterized protein n=1 Tax=Oedothorax gibbosus TaxID=931172 RepID=A0AAV6V712_9ARAC|nr:hypothetical protein JTE90_015175 [Oedothorax gibbosus]
MSSVPKSPEIKCLPDEAMTTNKAKQMTSIPHPKPPSHTTAGKKQEKTGKSKKFIHIEPFSRNPDVHVVDL